ncbi:MAG TPA: hypothetical protein VET66_10470 [Steroidobacteraceae bacterium]|nr:hypothetical protein [Steroidobacteraceae bacterium]
MDFFRFTGLTAIAALLALAGCAKQGQDEMGWARTALERNAQIEIVAADPQSRTFTVRVKDTGELRMVRADEVVAGPSGTALAAGAPPAEPAASAAAPPPQSAPTHAAAAPSATAAAGEAATADNAPASAGTAAEAPPAALTPQAAARDGGRLLEQGPGYSIRAAAAPAAPSLGRVRDSGVTSAAVERRHEPIVCQGARLLHIDNRNLEFDGDAVSAEDGCEIHITNSHISATGVGITARAANVHIDNSLIEGNSASIDASDGAQVYAASSRFKGLSRRLDTASFHDLGGNIWN